MPELIRYYRPPQRESLMVKLVWLSPGLLLIGALAGHLIEAGWR